MLVIIVSSILLVLNLVLWIIVFKKIRKEFSSEGTLSEVRQEVEKLIMEIDGVTDRNITLIEAKCNQIKEIIDTADRKISLFSDIMAKKENEQKILSQLSDMNGDVKINSSTKKAAKAYSSNKSAKKIPQTMPLFAENAGVMDIEGSKVPPKVLQQPNVEAGFSEINVKKAEEPVTPKVDISSKIIKMSREGFSSEMIASKLNVPISQVEITANLYS